VDLLHREQGPGFVRLGHNLIIALEVPAGGPICSLPMPALRCGARTRSSKDNRFRPTEGMNGRDPDEAVVFEMLSVYALLVPTLEKWPTIHSVVRRLRPRALFWHKIPPAWTRWTLPARCPPSALYEREPQLGWQGKNRSNRIQA